MSTDVGPDTHEVARSSGQTGRVEHFTVAERVARGKAARAEVPRVVARRLGAAAAPARPVELLEEQAQTRVPELVPIRYGRMLVSPFTFYRGAAYLMASDLAGMPRTGLHTQLCGDAHLSNFGVFAAPDRRLVFSINDFDETLPGPFEWDVKRLVASFAVAGRDRGFDDKSARDDQPRRSGGRTGRRSTVRRDGEPRRSGTRGSTSTSFSQAVAQARRPAKQVKRGDANVAKTTHEGQPEGVREADRDRRRRAAHHQRPAADRADRGRRLGRARARVRGLPAAA